MFGGVAVGTTVAVAVPLGLAVPAASCCVHESCRMPGAPAVIVKLAAPIPSRVPLPAPTNDPPVTVHANGAPIRPMTVAGIVPPVVTNAAASDAVGALARAMMVTSVKPLAVAPAWFTSVSAMRSGDCAALAVKNGIEPHAGHGLTYDNVIPIAAIPQFAELNIGHFLIGEAIFTGLEPSVRRMRELMDEARGPTT